MSGIHHLVLSEALGPQLQLALVDAKGNTNNSVDYAFSVSLGAEDPTRHIIIVSTSGADEFVSTLDAHTINGTASTMAIKTASANPTGISYQKVPTGTTATVVIDHSGGSNADRCYIAVYAVTGADTLEVLSTLGPLQPGVGGGSSNMTTSPRGVLIGAAVSNSGTNSFTFDGSTATSIGLGTSGAGETTDRRSITVTYDVGSNTRDQVVAASFKAG